MFRSLCTIYYIVTMVMVPICIRLRWLVVVCENEQYRVRIYCEACALCSELCCILRSKFHCDRIRKRLEHHRWSFGVTTFVSRRNSLRGRTSRLSEPSGIRREGRPLRRSYTPLPKKKKKKSRVHKQQYTRIRLNKTYTRDT